MIAARWHLPCYDGERVGHKIARMLGKHYDGDMSDTEKGKQRESGNESDTDVEYGTNLGAISQATTRVPSAMVSRQVSDEKMDATSRGGALGSEKMV